MSRVFFFIGEGIRALRRSAAPGLAAIVTVAVTVLLLGVLIPVLQTAASKNDEVRNQVEIRAFLNDEGASPEIPVADIDALEAQLEQLPHVQSVELVTKEQGLEKLGTQLETQNKGDLVDQLPGSDNPLPTSFTITPDDPDNLPLIKAGISPPGANGEPEPISPLIADVEDSRDEAETITEVTGAVQWFLIIIACLLMIASLMLVGNTIRLSIYARRREVEVMRLVGATNWFIRWPFMVEGLICGFIGGVIAVGVLFLGKEAVVDPLADSVNLISAEETIQFAKLVVVLLAVAMTVSAIGSGLTLRRFLRI
jgi:cell division transport system permease protein